MLKKIIILALVFGVGLDSLVYGGYDRIVSIDAELVYLQRKKDQNIPLVEIESPPPIQPGGLIPILPVEKGKCASPPGTEMLGTKQLIRDMGFEMGLRTALRWRISESSILEARYMGLLDWRGEEKITCIQNLRLKGPLAGADSGYRFVDTVKGSYASHFKTIDMNYWHHTTPRYIDYFSVSWILGLRYIDLDETFRLTFLKNDASSLLKANTSNMLLGGQLGGVLECNPYEFLTWGLGGRIGGFYTHQKAKKTQPSNQEEVTLKHFHKKDVEWSFSAELFPYIEINPTHWVSFNLSYELFYLSGVALAPKQISLSCESSSFDHRGEIILQGVTGGISIHF